MTISALERTGNSALMQLRRAKHENDLPFMLNSNDLSGKQCYLEYTDGHIDLVAIKSQADRNFTVIRKLTLAEQNEIRIRYQLHYQAIFLPT